MNLAALMAAMAVMASAGAEAKAPVGRQVVVYSIAHDVVPYQIEGAAKGQASKMFAEIGVGLLWLYGNPARPAAGSIEIEIVTGTPATFMPGALAYALPYEGVHIRILWDRIRDYTTPGEVLAHVMVHEITHILQGEASRHSDEGIMSAHWTRDDLARMARKPLGFMAGDVDLIYKGIERREAGKSARSTASGTRDTAPTVAGVADTIASR